MSDGGKWTINDVAEEAAVSVKTVSRVLNKEAGVRDDTRRRVLEVMQKVGYQPHAGARSLRGRAPNCLGVTLAAPADTVPLSDVFLTWLFGQLYQIFGQTGNYVCFDLNPYGYGGGGDYGRGLWESIYRGLVVIGPLRMDDAVLRRIHNSGSPYVAVGRLLDMPECSSATVDFTEAAYIATKFLIDRGHRRIALLSSMDGFVPGEERRRGYVKALEEAGIAPDFELVERLAFNSDSVTNGVHRTLTKPGVTALVDCSGAQDGDSIREGVRRAGRSLESNLELVGWTYTCDATVLPEALAHVWAPMREAVLAGLNELSDWFNGLREGPIKVLYRPILQLKNAGEPVQPRPVFRTQTERGD